MAGTDNHIYKLFFPWNSRYDFRSFCLIILYHVLNIIKKKIVLESEFLLNMKVFSSKRSGPKATTGMENEPKKITV